MSSANYQYYLNVMQAANHECSLCYEDFTDQHPPVVLDCRHVFGKECLEKWAESANAQRKNCPNCRAPLFEEDAPAAPPAQPTRPVQPVQPVQPIQPTLRVVNNAAPTTPIHDPILYDIDYHTRAIHHTFESSLYHPSSFIRKLWRRVSRTLAPLYIASNCLVTSELDTAARIVLVDVLRKFDYYTTALVVPEMDYKHLLQHSLGGDQVATLLTRRIMQWVMTMVMLSPMVPMEMDVIQGCFELLPDLHRTLDFDVVNAAAVEPTVEIASILKVMAMLLVDHSVEHVCTELGAQWYVDADPSAEFFVAATLVKERLGARVEEQEGAVSAAQGVERGCGQDVGGRREGGAECLPGHAWWASGTVSA
jgi:hypothetical protein